MEERHKRMLNIYVEGKVNGLSLLYKRLNQIRIRIKRVFITLIYQWLLKNLRCSTGVGGQASIVRQL